MKSVYETVVYDGATKVFRVLNINTGLIYNMNFKDKAKAEAAIDDGCIRYDMTVKSVSLSDVQTLLIANHN